MKELVQWPRAKYWDKCWNPIIGCRPCSPACDNCYARTWAERFGQSFNPHETSRWSPPRKGVVFCGNMTDLFGEWLWPSRGHCTTRSPGDYISMTLGPSKATYLWLTKRAERMVDTLLHHSFPVEDYMESLRGCDLSNHYFGITAEDRERYAERLLPLYRGRESWMKFWISCEPLLGPIDLGLRGDLIPGTFQWVVVGCESGPNRRPCKVEWVESIVEQCRVAGVPVFVKQLDLGGECVKDINQFPEHLRIRQVPWAEGEP